MDAINSMIHVLKSGGLVMIPLGILSVIAMAIIIERFWILRRSQYLKPATVATINQFLAAGRYRQAVDWCRRNPSPLADLVAPMVENRHAPYEELKQILEDTARHQLHGLQRGLPLLGTVVARAPLLGLLGTVVGMIKIFSVVASSASQITEQLSLGISEALVTTATGLIIAIPALFIHSLLESRAMGIVSDIESQLLDFLHLVRRDEGVDDTEDVA